MPRDVQLSGAGTAGEGGASPESNPPIVTTGRHYVQVRIIRDVTAYHSPSCQTLTFHKDDLVTGDLAVFLRDTNPGSIEDVQAAPAEPQTIGSGASQVPAEKADPVPPVVAVTEPDVDREDPAAGESPEPAPSPVQAEGGVFDPSEHTIPEVDAYVAEHPGERERILAAELAPGGKGRKVLVAHLS